MFIKKINKAKLLKKALQDTLKKSFEFIAIGIALGISAKLLTASIIGVFGGTLIAKTLIHVGSSELYKG